MKYINYNRKIIRVKDYDYSSEGYYYVTICTKNRENLLSELLFVGADVSVRPEEKLKLTPIGKIVEECLNYINTIYDNVCIDKYVIMPNHVHLIVQLKGRTETSAPTKDYSKF